MLYSGELVKLRRPPRLIASRNSRDWKFPKYVELDAPVFSYDGFYQLRTEEVDKGT